VVTGTPTASKIQVSGTLVDEVVGTAKTLKVSNLPQSVEQAALATCKAWWLARKGGGGPLAERQVGDLRVRYLESAQTAIPGLAAALLAPFVRLG